MLYFSHRHLIPHHYQQHHRRIVGRIRVPQDYKLITTPLLPYHLFRLEQLPALLPGIILGVRNVNCVKSTIRNQKKISK